MSDDYDDEKWILFVLVFIPQNGMSSGFYSTIIRRNSEPYSIS
jgi:hypothetical protein